PSTSSTARSETVAGRTRGATIGCSFRSTTATAPRWASSGPTTRRTASSRRPSDSRRYASSPTRRRLLCTRRSSSSRCASSPIMTLLNRRSFVQHLDAEVARSRRYNRPLALVIFDLDELKIVNDTQGHAAGDEAIKDVADALRAMIRTGDNAFRIGGDEFAVL